MSPPVAADRLQEGNRLGRFVILRDVEGRLHAVSPSSVGAICEIDDGSLLMLPGGRMLQVSRDLGTVLGWFDVC